VIIEVENLVKRYGGLTAVDDISFDVAAGAVFAFLGANCDGKTTTINCLTTILGFDSGVLRVNGHLVGPDNAVIRREIGVVFQESVLDPLLTVRENLYTRARFYGLGSAAAGRIAELAAMIDLGDFLDQRYGNLSGGQQRRVDIARALVHSPSIIFLDEPTAGLDPKSRENVWSTIAAIRAQAGLSVLLTTHYMEETERSDDIVIIDRGRIIARGTPAQLRAQHSHDRLRVRGPDLAALEEAARHAGHPTSRTVDVVEISVDASAQALAFLTANQARIDDFEFQHGSMDDVFLTLTERTEADR
jgi:multidrug/hemolysin transport system ATP-binding protein